MFVWKKYVYEVYKERSFTKAAQNLYISQPSLSARIKKIEEIKNVPGIKDAMFQKIKDSITV